MAKKEKVEAEVTEVAEVTEAVESSEATESPEVSTKALEEEGDIAADYLEELLDIFDLDGDIDIDVRQGRAYLEISSEQGGNLRLISEPDTVEALQELTRLAVQVKNVACSMRASGDPGRRHSALCPCMCGPVGPLRVAMDLTLVTIASSRSCCRVKIHRPLPLTPLPVRHVPFTPGSVGGPPLTSAQPS